MKYKVVIKYPKQTGIKNNITTITRGVTANGMADALNRLRLTPEEIKNATIEEIKEDGSNL